MWVSDVAWLASKVRYDEGAGWEQWPNLCASVEELCVAGIEVDTHGAVQDGVLQGWYFTDKKGSIRSKKVPSSYPPASEALAELLPSRLRGGGLISLCC